MLNQIIQIILSSQRQRNQRPLTLQLMKRHFARSQRPKLQRLKDSPSTHDLLLNLLSAPRCSMKERSTGLLVRCLQWDPSCWKATLYVSPVKMSAAERSRNAMPLFSIRTMDHSGLHSANSFAIPIINSSSSTHSSLNMQRWALSMATPSYAMMRS